MTDSKKIMIVTEAIKEAGGFAADQFCGVYDAVEKAVLEEHKPTPGDLRGRLSRVEDWLENVGTVVAGHSARLAKLEKYSGNSLHISEGHRITKLEERVKELEKQCLNLQECVGNRGLRQDAYERKVTHLENVANLLITRLNKSGRLMMGKEETDDE